MTDIDIPAAMDKAAEIIETEGKFGKGTFCRGGQYCTLGAFALGLGVTFDQDGLMDVSQGEVMAAFNEGWEHLSKTVRGIEGSPYGFVQSMNDGPETTADQMATVLRETADRLRAAAA